MVEGQRAGDRQHHGRASQKPGKRDLGSSRTVPLGDLAERFAAVAVQRVEGHEHDSSSGAIVDDVLVPALGEVVPVLNGGDRNDLPSPLDLVDSNLGETDVADLPDVVVRPDCGEALFEGRLRVDSV